MKIEESHAQESGREGGAKPPAAHKVLIVDDDDEASQAIAELVRSLGHQPLRCGHVPAALELTRLEEIDVILADYRMPEMTGLDLVWMLRQDGCNIPVVMMTGYVGTVERISSEKGNHFTILKKPISLDQLRKAIQEQLPAPAGSV